jgi:hypothetical protein
MHTVISFIVYVIPIFLLAGNLFNFYYPTTPLQSALNELHTVVLLQGLDKRLTDVPGHGSENTL